MYDIEFTKTALAGIIKLQKSEPICYKKLYKLIEELKIHPKTGTIKGISYSNMVKENKQKTQTCI